LSSEVGSDASGMLPVARGPQPPRRRENPKTFDLMETFDGGGRSHSRTCLPPANSLLTGKLTGNFAKFSVPHRI
jgi:hypothetical protein